MRSLRGRELSRGSFIGWMGLPVILAISLSSYARTAAAPLRPALHWVRGQGAEACIDPIELAQRVEVLTGPVFVAPASAQLALAGDIVRTKEGFRVRLVSSGVDGVLTGERVLTLRAGSCRQLDTAIAFVLALMLDPELSAADLPSDVLAQLAEETPPEQTLLSELLQSPPQPHHPLEPTRATAKKRVLEPLSGQSSGVAVEPHGAPGTRYLAAAAGSVDGHFLPAWAPGARAAIGIERGLGLLIVSGKFASDVGSQRLSGDARASFRVVEFDGAACPTLGSWRNFSSRACLHASIARLQAEGIGFDRNRRATLWNPGLAAGLGAGVALVHGVGLWTEASARLSLLAQHFNVLAPDGTPVKAYRVPRVALSFCLGTSYEF